MKKEYQWEFIMRNEKIRSWVFSIPFFTNRFPNLSTQDVIKRAKNKRMIHMIYKRRCYVLRYARRYSCGVKPCVRVDATDSVKIVDHGWVGLHHCSVSWYCTDSKLYSEIQILRSYSNAASPITLFKCVDCIIVLTPSRSLDCICL